VLLFFIPKVIDCGGKTKLYMKITYRTRFYSVEEVGNGCEVDQRILECIDVALEKLGVSVRDAIYFYVKRDFGLDRCDILGEVGVFEEALVFIFGVEGAGLVLDMIVGEIRGRFGFERVGEKGFGELVALVRGGGGDCGRR
jgi:hypothetical protein